MALMVDPSLLLRPWTVDDVRDGLPASVSATFFELARDGALPDPVLASFGPRGVDRREVAELARGRWFAARGLEPHRAGPEEALPLEVRDPVVRAILLDEWSFLQRGSWLASRIRRPFTAFVRGGAAAIELPNEALDARGDLPGVLEPERRLRVATSWLALGVGASMLDALTAELPAPVAGAFLLFQV